MEITKDSLQKEAVTLARDHKSLILEWATGVGKTKASCDILKMLSEAKREAGYITPLRVLILIAEVAHRKNWKEEFLKWLDVDMIDLSMDCYQSIHKHVEGKYDLLICDEMHHVGSDKRLSYLEGIHFDRFLGLTATLKKSIEMNLSDMLGGIRKHTVSLSDAIEWNLIPRPGIVCVPITLSDEPVEKVVQEWGRKERRAELECFYKDMPKFLSRRKFPDARLTVHLSEKEKNKWFNEQADYWKTQFMNRREEYLKTKWMKVGLDRKRWLGSLKGERVKEIIGELKGKRFICFCSNIEQAEELGNGNTIHSRKEGCQDIIERFNNKEIDSIFAVGMLQEGMNLKDIDAGIIIQLDGEIRGFIQKMGRIVRGKSPVVYLPYIVGSRDQDYLNKALENAGESEIYYLEK